MAKKKTKFITQIALANKLGIKPERVRQWVFRGTIKTKLNTEFGITLVEDIDTIPERNKL